MEMNIDGAWEPLGKGCRVLVTKAHGFTTDTILLADFAAPRKNTVCADFGAGCGTIALLWAMAGAPQKIYGIELQENACRQMEASVRENGYSQVQVLRTDLREKKQLPRNLDLVACNPPYKASGAGLQNSGESACIARHEAELTLPQLAEAAAYSLKFGGRFCICQRPERLTDAMAVFREKGLEPKRLRLVEQRAGKAASLFLLECRRGGKPGLTLLSTLRIEENGGFSQEMLEIYGDYRNESERME